MELNKKYLPAIKRILGVANIYSPRYLILTGGRGSGKTFALDNLLIRRVLQERGDVILYTRYTLGGIRNGVLPEWRKLNVEFPEFYMTNISATFGNTRIIFDGIKSASPNKLKSIGGCSIFICDEASDIMKEQEFDTIEQSIRAKDKDNLIILILNPTTPDHWIYKRFYQNKKFEKIMFNEQEYIIELIDDPNVIHIHTTFLDNLNNLSESFLNIIKDRQKKSPKQFVNQYLGLWVDYDGTKILRYTISDEIDRNLPCAIGVDFGYYPDPTAIVKVYCCHQSKRLFVEVLEYKHKMTADEVKNELLKYSDYRIVCDTNIKTITEPLRLSGLDIYYKNMKIELLQQLLALSEWEIYTNSVKLIQELQTYRMGDKNNIIVGTGDHAIDALRYAAFALIREC